MPLVSGVKRLIIGAAVLLLIAMAGGASAGIT